VYDNLGTPISKGAEVRSVVMNFNTGIVDSRFKDKIRVRIPINSVITRENTTLKRYKVIAVSPTTVKVI